MDKPENNTVTLPRLIGMGEVAKRLGICRATAFNLVRDNRLRSVKVGARRLVPDTELIAFVQRCAA